jgi:hypothetical protein
LFAQLQALQQKRDAIQSDMAAEQKQSPEQLQQALLAQVVMWVL